MALSNARSRYERVHHHWRQRYRVASDSHMLRPKRRGVACQQLRANAALVIEWFLILMREGWLASARDKKREADRKEREGRADGTGKIGDAAKSLTSFLARRRRIGLDQPYGAAAKKRDPKAPDRPKGRHPGDPGDPDA